MALASSMAAGLLWLASLAALVYGYPRLALLLWLGAGAGSAGAVTLFALYAQGARLLAAELGVEPPRPRLDPWVAAATALAAPPAAGLLIYAAVRQVLDVADAASGLPGGEPREVAEAVLGGAALEPLEGLAAASVFPPLLPLLVPRAALAARVAACAAYEAARRSPRGRGLLDKPCRPDLVDVVVWAKPLGLTLDLESLLEQWSVQD